MASAKSSQSECRFFITVTPSLGWPPVTRHSVELMRSAVKRRIIDLRSAGYQSGHGRAEWVPYFTAASSLDEAGGAIGPLPDGTLIEVVRR